MGQRCWPIGQILRHFGDPILTHAHILFDCADPWLMAGGSPKPFGFTSPLAAPTPETEKVVLVCTTLVAVISSLSLEQMERYADFGPQISAAKVDFSGASGGGVAAQ